MRMKSVDKMLRTLIDTRQALTASAYTYCFGPSLLARPGALTGSGLLAATLTDILLARASVLAGPALVFLIVVIAIRKL